MTVRLCKIQKLTTESKRLRVHCNGIWRRALGEVLYCTLFLSRTSTGHTWSHHRKSLQMRWNLLNFTKLNFWLIRLMIRNSLPIIIAVIVYFILFILFCPCFFLFCHCILFCLFYFWHCLFYFVLTWSPTSSLPNFVLEFQCMCVERKA